jgi:2-keto-4-pentenoate hydratase/2-oxohepta-3-ene-1,7-dioic acid hydratase in catechol pathway
MGPTKGKSFDTGNAIGPWIVTADEIPDPQALEVCLRVNGEEWVKNTTAGMIHSFEDMISFVSQDETLHPGEFFGSGTIGGCSGLESDKWLKDGDVVEAEVEKIGVLRNRVVRRRR